MVEVRDATSIIRFFEIGSQSFFILLESRPMNLFEILFPQQAQAVHLKTLAQSSQHHQAMALRSQQIAKNQQARQELRLTHRTDQRISELENELAQSAIVIESLITLLEEKNLVSRDELKQRVQQLDATDGVIDGKLTPPNEQPFRSNLNWPAE